MIVVSRSPSGPTLSLDSYKSMIWISFAVHIKSSKMVTSFSPNGNWSLCSVRLIIVANLITLAQ